MKDGMILIDTNGATSVKSGDISGKDLTKAIIALETIAITEFNINRDMLELAKSITALELMVEQTNNNSYQYHKGTL